MDDVAQLVRASDCGSEGRGFETHHCPSFKLAFRKRGFFYDAISIVFALVLNKNPQMTPKTKPPI